MHTHAHGRTLTPPADHRTPTARRIFLLPIISTHTYKYIDITGPINSLSCKIRQVVLDIYPSPFPSTTPHRRHHPSPHLSPLLSACTRRRSQPLSILYGRACVCVTKAHSWRNAGRKIRFYCVLRLPVAKRGCTDDGGIGNGVVATEGARFEYLSIAW